jgi:hypothetical protein
MGLSEWLWRVSETLKLEPRMGFPPIVWGPQMSRNSNSEYLLNTPRAIAKEGYLANNPIAFDLL